MFCWAAALGVAEGCLLDMRYLLFGRVVAGWKDGEVSVSRCVSRRRR